AVETPETTKDGALPLASNWLPPDVAEKGPPVEPGAACSPDNRLPNAGNIMLPHVHDDAGVTPKKTQNDETTTQQSTTFKPDKRRFDCLVSIQDLRSGYVGVTEFRNGGGAQTEFPDGIVTSGLPALVLVFHPYYAPNYEMSWEGLSRSSRGLAWQVHFRQKQG